jgi:hypothetical protein
MGESRSEFGGDYGMVRASPTLTKHCRALHGSSHFNLTAVDHSQFAFRPKLSLKNLGSDRLTTNARKERNFFCS